MPWLTETLCPWELPDLGYGAPSPLNRSCLGPQRRSAPTKVTRYAESHSARGLLGLSLSPDRSLSPAPIASKRCLERLFIAESRNGPRTHGPRTPRHLNCMTRHGGCGRGRTVRCSGPHVPRRRLPVTRLRRFGPSIESRSSLRQLPMGRNDRSHSSRSSATRQIERRRVSDRRATHSAPMRKAPAEPAWFTVSQLCQRWQLGRKTIYKFIDNRLLPAWRASTHLYRVAVADVLRFEERNRFPPK